MGERIMLEPTFGEEVEQEESKPSMLIVTGPQGSGNHLFEKLFNLCLNSKKWVKWVSKNFIPEKNKEKPTIS